MPMTDRDDTYLTVYEAARALGVDSAWIRDLLLCGKLEGEKAGNRWQIPEAAVLARKERLAGHAGSPQHVKPKSFTERVNS